MDLSLAPASDTLGLPSRPPRLSLPPQLLRLPESGALLAVEPQPGALVSAVYLWLPHGAAAERPQEVGLAHLLEHMLFKGAGEHGVSEAAARIEGMGGDLNAFTSYEQTVLHATLPAGREREALALLAEMAFAPRLDPEELEREKKVVIEEIRGAQDDPTDRLAERLRQAAHRGHPYGRPILGTEATVSALGVEDLRRFHRAFHRPADALVVLAGPVEAAALAPGIDQLLARFERGEPAPPPPRAPARPEATAFVLPGFEERTIELAFPIPGLRHEDLPALDLLATALGDGDASILVRRLRDELDLAMDAWAALETEPDAGLLVVGASPRAGKAAACASALMSELLRAASERLPPASLERARRAILLSRIWERETVDGRASRLAWYLASFGDPAEEQRFEARIAATSAEAVRQAAARWCRPEAAIAGAVAPRRELSARALRERVLSAAAPAPRPAPPPTHRVVLRNGLVVVFEPDPEAEVVALSLVGVGGALLEPARLAGLGSAWASLLSRGADGLDAAELAVAIEDLGMSLRSWRARNSMGLDLRVPARGLPEAVDLLGAILRAPAFAPEELERCVDDLDEARASLLLDDPGGLAWSLGWAGLFPGHPWGRLAQGTEASLRRIRPAHLRSYHQRGMAGENLVLGVTGAVDPERFLPRLQRALGGLPRGAPIQPAPPAPPARFLRRLHRRSPREQAHLVLAFPAPGHGDPRAPALRLLEGVLGGQSGRLFLRVREERGLAYDVSCSASEGLGGGALLVSAAVDPRRRAEAWAALEATLAELRESLLPAEELERVKARVVDGALLGLQRAADRAAQIATAERYGPGADHWREALRRPRAVTAEELRALAGELLRPDRRVEVEVRPGRSARARRGG